MLMNAASCITFSYQQDKYSPADINKNTLYSEHNSIGEIDVITLLSAKFDSIIHSKDKYNLACDVLDQPLGNMLFIADVLGGLGELEYRTAYGTVMKLREIVERCLLECKSYNVNSFYDILYKYTEVINNTAKPWTLIVGDEKYSFGIIGTEYHHKPKVDSMSPLILRGQNLPAVIDCIKLYISKGLLDRVVLVAPEQKKKK